MGKIESYQQIIPQIKSLVEQENDLYANLGNISSAIHYHFNFHWTGFYLVKNEELVLGPFQGPVACTRIAYGKGVCGTAWKTKEIMVVEDVHKFEGHIACSALSNSEIVIPLIKNNIAWGVLDIDSIKFSTFDKVDAKYLTEICNLINSM